LFGNEGGNCLRWHWQCCPFSLASTFLALRRYGHFHPAKTAKQQSNKIQGSLFIACVDLFYRAADCSASAHRVCRFNSLVGLLGAQAVHRLAVGERAIMPLTG